jgi:hypothetical protein
MERLLIYFYSDDSTSCGNRAKSVDAIFSHQFASSKPFEERPSQADNRSLQNPVNLERDTFSDWSMQGFVVWN